MLQKGRDDPLVFFRGEGAGGIDQPPAGPHGRCGILQDLLLSGGTQVDIVQAPAIQRLRLLAEHPLAGAGGVHQHSIKPGGQPGAQPAGIAAGDHSAPYPQPFQILLQDAGACRHILIAPQQAGVLQGGSDLPGFTARCGAQIQYPFTGLRCQHTDRRAGRRFLHIVGAGVVQRIAAGLVGDIQVKAVRRKRRWLQRQGG